MKIEHKINILIAKKRLKIIKDRKKALSNHHIKDATLQSFMAELELQQYPSTSIRKRMLTVSGTFSKPNGQSGVYSNYVMARKRRMKSKDFKNLRDSF